VTESPNPGLAFEFFNGDQSHLCITVLLTLFVCYTARSALLTSIRRRRKGKDSVSVVKTTRKDLRWAWLILLPMASYEISSDDSELEEMLRQAAMLEAQLTSSSTSIGERSLYEESAQAVGRRVLDEGLSLAYSEDAGMEEGDTDDMLLQAQLLATKMRAPSSATSREVLDQSDASIDEMLHKAELLALKIKSAETTPLSSPGRTTHARKALPVVDDTPALIRNSERLLSDMRRSHNEDSKTMTTPELMYQTKHLIERMKPSSHNIGAAYLVSDRSPPKEGTMRGDVSSTNDVLSTSDVLLAAATSMSSSDRQIASHASTVFTPPVMPSGDHDMARSEELRQLMEDALSTWTKSGDDASRVKEALDQLIPKFRGAPDAVSLSTQQAETDEMSSVGSASPRTLPKELLTTESLTHKTRPPLLPPSHDVSAAVEMARNMANALRETRSEASSDAGDDPSVTVTPTVKSTSNGHLLEAHEQVNEETQPLTTTVPEKRSTGWNDETKERVQTRPRRHVSSEEAQYSAIMSAIHSVPKAGVSWEKVTSASTDDDDYVSFVDYSKNAGVRKKSAGIASIIMPTKFSRLPRRRKNKLARRIFAVITLIAIALLARVWLNRGTDGLNSDVDEATTTEMDIPVETAGFEEKYITSTDEPVMGKKENNRISEETAGFEERYIEDTDELVMGEKEDNRISEENEDFHSVEIVNSGALQKFDAGVRCFPKIRMKVSQTVRHVGKLLMLFVVRLTPPWERFCGPDDKAACRNTAFLMSSIGTA
jgi:hypothetical protein